MSGPAARTAPVADTIAGVPVLMAEPPHLAPDGSSPPVVLWFHGFRADALANAGELTRLADAGLLAIGVDAAGHGRRADPALGERIASRGAYPLMLELATRTALEIPGILREIERRGLGNAARVGLVGVSMGAFLVYRALGTVRVRAVAALLGSPEWPDADSPHRRDPARFADVALLSITAGRDESVPPAAARAFHDRLGPAAGGSAGRTHGGSPPLRHRYLELPGAPHLVDAAGWETMMRATVDWMASHLLSRGDGARLRQTPDPTGPP